MFARPTLSDLPTTKRFQAGDRILARVSVDLTKDQHDRICRTIQRWARAEVDVLIINCLKVSLLWRQVEHQAETILGRPTAIVNSTPDLGVANLDCSVVNFEAGDQLVVTVFRLDSNLQRDTIKSWIQRWAGQGVEVIVQAGLYG